MKQRLFVILNLSLVSGFVILGVSIISPILPQYALSFDIPVALVGWAISAFALARLVTDIPAGFLADRFGRKKVMISGLVLVIVASVAAGIATTYAWLIVSRIVAGLGSALYMTSATTWVAQVSAGSARGRYMSLYTGLVFAGTAFGPTIGGYVAARFGLNAPFFAYALFALAGLIATLPMKETADSAQATRSEIHISDIVRLLSNRSFMLVNCAILAVFFLRIGVRSTLVPLYADLNLGLPPDSIGIILTVAAVTTLYGLATGLQGSIAAWPADLAPKERLGTSMGVCRVMGDAGMVLGPIAATYIADYTGDLTVTLTPFLVPAIVTTIVGLLLIKAKDPAARRHAEEYMVE